MIRPKAAGGPARFEPDSMADLSPATEMRLPARLAERRTLTSALCGSARSRAPSCRRSRQLFPAPPSALALRSGSGIPKALADLEAHRIGGRNLQGLTGLQVTAAAGAALIDLQAAEAGEIHRVALADGSFDPGEHAPHDGFDHGLRLPGVGCDAFDHVSEKHDALPLLSSIAAVARRRGRSNKQWIKSISWQLETGRA